MSSSSPHSTLPLSLPASTLSLLDLQNNQFAALEYLTALGNRASQMKTSMLHLLTDITTLDTAITTHSTYTSGVRAGVVRLVGEQQQQQQQNRGGRQRREGDEESGGGGGANVVLVMEMYRYERACRELGRMRGRREVLKKRYWRKEARLGRYQEEAGVWEKVVREWQERAAELMKEQEEEKEQEKEKEDL